MLDLICVYNIVTTFVTTPYTIFVVVNQNSFCKSRIYIWVHGYYLDKVLHVCLLACLLAYTYLLGWMVALQIEIGTEKSGKFNKIQI